MRKWKGLRKRTYRCIPSLVPVSSVRVRKDTTVCKDGGQIGRGKGEQGGEREHVCAETV